MRTLTSIAATLTFALLIAVPATGEEKHHPEGTPPKADTQCEPGMGMMCMMGRRMAMGEPVMEQRAQRHLAALKAELKITDGQAKAWDDFAAAVTAAAKAMTEQRKAMMEKAGTATLPQRLDLHEAMLASHLEQLRKTKAAASALYAVLSDDQKRVADKSALGMGMMRGPMRGSH